MRTKQLVTAIYGLIAIGVGVWRQLETGTSPQAMWFGMIAGGIAIAGAFLLSLRNRIPGYALIFISVVFVGGWFLHRVLSGHSEGLSPRVILILAACAVELVVLCRKTPKPVKYSQNSLES